MFASGLWATDMDPLWAASGIVRVRVKLQGWRVSLLHSCCLNTMSSVRLTVSYDLHNNWISNKSFRFFPNSCTVTFTISPLLETPRPLNACWRAVTPPSPSLHAQAFRVGVKPLLAFVWSSAFHSGAVYIHGCFNKLVQIPLNSSCRHVCCIKGLSGGKVTPHIKCQCFLVCNNTHSTTNTDASLI